MTSTVVVAGVGMVPFAKPGASAAYDQMGAAASSLALADAGVDYESVQQAYAGYVYGDSTAGQKAIYPLGLTGIPSSTSTTIVPPAPPPCFSAGRRSRPDQRTVSWCWASNRCGLARWVRYSPIGRAPSKTLTGLPIVLSTRTRFPWRCAVGGAGLSHMKKYGTKLETFAKVRAKASRHARNNPLAIFRKEVTAEDVMSDKFVWPGVMTRLMACPPTCGAAAAILTSETFAKRRGLRTDVRIAAQAMVTDFSSTFDTDDMMRVVGFDMARTAANRVYEQAGVGPEDINVVELHDCFAQNELISYEALSLCPEGGAEAFVEDGDNTYGGKVVTNPSGGLLSKGHPLGATGLAQCYELTRQLRGTADATQVERARLGLQHNLGLGGACVVTLFERT